ncbi:MAG: hypothetical protein EP335_16215 [Alphaproteobacteria bacterium]|nr:MAG: hypothetical protein EP335_16215 [Alphaproteobacteria bacterium]
MQVTLGKVDIIILLGALMAIIGAFSPLLDIARIGSISYADAADPQVYLLLAFAVGAGVLAVMGKKMLSLCAAAGAWLVLLWPVLKNMGSGDDDGLLGKVRDLATDPVERFAGRLFNNILDLEWGGYMFLAGMLLLLAGAIMAALAARKAA